MGALAALPAHAQLPGKVWRVGFIGPEKRPVSIESERFGAFSRGLRDLGYIEGKNLIIEWRFAEGNTDRLAELAAEFVRLKVDVIVLVGTAAARAAQKVTAAIPIVFIGPGDPVAQGLVMSLARPGGNITGPATITGDLSLKRLKLLLEMVPKLSRVAVMQHPDAPASNTMENIQAAAQKRRVQIVPVKPRTPQEIEFAFQQIIQQKATALMVLLYPFYQEQRRQIAELSIKHRLPCMAADRAYAEAGCLMSYGNSLADDFRRAATYVDKIFKGAKPADLPVEQPTKIELVVNLKTARALGLTIPQSVQLQADEVIK